MGNYGSIESEEKDDVGERIPEKVFEESFRGRTVGNSNKYTFEVTDGLKNIETEQNYGFIPCEILHEIFLFLQPTELLGVFLSCRLFHRVTHSKYFWRCYHQNRFEIEGNQSNVKNWKLEFFERYCRDDVGYKRKFKVIPREQEGSHRALAAKVVILGDFGTGKTALALRFISNRFEERAYSIGAAFRTQKLHNTVSDQYFTMELWDHASEERYRSLAPMYYRGASGAIICFSIDSSASFYRAKSWVDEMKRHADHVPNLTILLAGNKCDLENERKVDQEEAKEYAREAGLCGYVETSAKDDINVWVAFGMLTERIMERLDTIPQEEEDDPFKLLLKIEPEGNESCFVM